MYIKQYIFYKQIQSPILWGTPPHECKGWLVSWWWWSGRSHIMGRCNRPWSLIGLYICLYIQCYLDFHCISWYSFCCSTHQHPFWCLHTETPHSLNNREHNRNIRVRWKMFLNISECIPTHLHHAMMFAHHQNDSSWK